MVKRFYFEMETEDDYDPYCAVIEGEQGSYVLASDYDALRQEFLDLHEKVSALESREVCAAAHDNVETCGYCQRDVLEARVKALEGLIFATIKAPR